VVVQKRGSLLVGWNDGALTSEGKFLAEDAWDCDQEGGDEEDTHDDEGKDPLESNGVGEELTNTNRGCQDAQCKAHGIILVGNKEEKSIDQNTPDEDIRHYSCCQGVGIGSNGTVPVQGNKRPCQWSRNDRDVNESWVGVVAEVKGRQVEEVENQDQLRPNIVATHEQHHECKVEEVADDKVTSYTGGCVDIVGIGGEEGPDISDLQDEEDNPVEGGDDLVLSERSVVSSVDSPDGVAPALHIITWCVEGVVESGDYEKEPGESGQDLISPDRLGGVGLASCERVEVGPSHFGVFCCSDGSK